ncbi:MAG: membrane protein insertion efficiency factor YidD [Acidobacteria bacterium]|nr:MAG: membrane protein insertion efficiency factor YidD [Acidobacteriota bacterium]
MVAIRKRRLLFVLIFLLAGTTTLLAWSPSAGSNAALAAIHAYRRYGSPLVTRAGIECRFQPTCSRYAEVAIGKYGLMKGTFLTAKRLLRCTPLTPKGTVDLP